MAPEATPAPATAPAKKQRKADSQALRQPRPEDLDEGTHVVYWGGYTGVVRDAYVPLDEFWVTDTETGQIVRDEQGQIVQFKAAELQLAPQQNVPALPAGITRSAVIILGREDHMVKVLEHFGEPDQEERRNPQQLLAIPAHMCGDLSAATTDGVGEELMALARRLRPDLHVGVRASQMKQAVEKIGPDLLRLEGYYCLCGVQLPYNEADIEAPDLGEWERHHRRNIANQVDLCPTAFVEHPTTEKSDVSARLALGETCGIEVSDMLWEQNVQQGLRKSLGVDFATEFKDVNDANVSVVLLPEDAVVTKIHGVLCFGEAPGADYAGGKKAKAAAGGAASASGKPDAAAASMAKADGDGDQQIQGKTIRQWEQEQAEEFAHLPKLPSGWLRVKSRKSGDVYFFNKKTQEATFELPLPAGWTKQASKSTGKVYYSNASTKVCTFERPTQ